MAHNLKTVEPESERVKYYLGIWKGWMLHHDNGLGYPKKAASCTGAGKRRFEDFCDAVDLEVAEAVDAVLSGLPLYQQAAVHHFNLSAVWRFRRIRIEDAYALALDALEIGLRKKGLT